MKKYRITHRYWKVEEKQCEDFVIERKVWYGWKKITHLVGSWGECWRETKTFKTFIEAKDYLYALIEKAPIDVSVEIEL